MAKIQMLDCTLRDGGYCNQWKFGFANSKRIITSLIEADINIIECGFITDRVEYDPNVTKYRTVSQIAEIIPANRENKLFVAMMNFGEYDVDELPVCDGTSIDGIRIAFHKRNRFEALELCKKIKEKGYLVFIQAMVSLSYSDEEFLEMIRLANQLEPYAFYIVDSFGEMKRKDLTRLFYLVEYNLAESIMIGFHSHNNMQLAYSNAQSLVDRHSKRDLIIDASVYGMGRGAGNLNTELFVEYLNDNAEGKYDIKPLLTIIDEILNSFYQQNYWGYSLPNYLSAVHHTHPNYAGYLDARKTLTVESMNAIFDMMDDEKRVSYDKNYIEELYLRYMATGKTHEEHKQELSEKLRDKTVLLIAPGRSSVDEKEKIIACASQDNIVVVSVNFDYSYAQTDLIFLSNIRRYRQLEAAARKKCIVTSNIQADGVYLQTNYKDLLIEDESVKDNAGLMAIKFLISLGVQKIYLAGMDGYAHDLRDNYGDEVMTFIMRNAVLDATNAGVNRMLKKFSCVTELSFLTTPKYIKL